MVKKDKKLWKYGKYSDRTKDTLLASSDHPKILFCVDGYMLQSVSNLLNTVTVYYRGYQITPLNYGEEAIAFFLDQLHDPEPEPPKTWAVAKHALNLCGEYRSGIIEELIRGQLDSVVDQAPWEIFCLANGHDDIRLAKKSLRVMSKDQQFRTMSLNNLGLEEAAKPSLSYLLGLLKVMGPSNHDLPRIAQDFAPLS
ncbi:hypothetical protein L486_02138 [Kwoniella mangroviensis CBS 10435]|uniref:BTB domain-containing protein n=1 Tax=Kwoniella mangroviensis CBS 10435 TaxID=1331196 RepID=A0A1B9IVC1_9TREE|nr:hypothetical protein L486_02138 [Kwoniella mangroviensis CBS 10435]